MLYDMSSLAHDMATHALLYLQRKHSDTVP